MVVLTVVLGRSSLDSLFVWWIPQKPISEYQSPIVQKQNRLFRRAKTGVVIATGLFKTGTEAERKKQSSIGKIAFYGRIDNFTRG